MKILFANVPADGHFNPLTGLAAHLHEAGHDVRWYTGAGYAARLEALGIPHFPFRRAREINGDNVADVFPERARLKGPALIKFDFEQFFILNVASYFDDIREIDTEFSFDVLVCDVAFLGARLARQALGRHAVAIGPGPRLDTSKAVPPNFVGLKPARTPIGRGVHRAMAKVMDRMVLAHGRDIYNKVLVSHVLAPVQGSMFDEFYRGPEIVFQCSVPGFEYPRPETNTQVRYIGLLPEHRRSSPRGVEHAEKRRAGQRLILVSQGTVDNRDPDKLIVPALKALVDSGDLLVVGTGHRNTERIRKEFPQANVVIEDYIDFAGVLEEADLFICNGGAGSVLLSLSKGVPILGAGIREGKNDINAHVDYFGVGVDLKTERPTPDQIRRAAERVLGDPQYRRRATELQVELARYRPLEIIDQYLAAAIPAGAKS